MDDIKQHEKSIENEIRYCSVNYKNYRKQDARNILQT